MIWKRQTMTTELTWETWIWFISFLEKMKTFYMKNIIMLRGDNCFIRKSLLKHHRFSFAFYQDPEKLVFCYLHAGVRFHACYKRKFCEVLERFSIWFLDISLIVIFSIFFSSILLLINPHTFYWSKMLNL